MVQLRVEYVLFLSTWLFYLWIKYVIKLMQGLYKKLTLKQLSG